MRLGSAELTIVSDGAMRMDGGSMFGVVPKVIWSRRDPPDRKNRVTVGLNCLLIRHRGKTVLVDAGAGTKHSRQARTIYGMRAGKLVSNLAQQGVQPQDVDLVVLTHLHFDHVGGCTRYHRGTGQPVPVFPRATHLAQQADWDEASNTNERTHLAYHADDFVPLQDSQQMELLDGDTELLPGLWVRHTGGHTAGHQMVYLESDGEKLASFGDVVPTAEHLPLTYITAIDLYPMESLAAKRRWLTQAEEENWLLVFGHGVGSVAGRLTRNDRGRLVLAPEPVE
ncbi:MAG: MBL fold metallo-hydrolase [Chloroflexi bacterium]|nr:MBL fold metallo-hydrolase [Chloroflexota bacterium]